jgi:hypothetical protein
MALQEVEQEFVVRYYRWALSDATREVESGFPLLAQLGSQVVVSYLEHMRGLAQGERQEFAAAMVKRSHPLALGLTNERVSDREAAMVLEFASTRLAGASFQREQGKVSAATVWRSLRCELDRGEFGKYQSLGGRRGKYRRILGSGWILITSIGWVGFPYYWHSIWARENQVLANTINLCSWLGISSQTRWGPFEEHGEERVAQHVRLVAGHFVDSASALLDGLEPGAA